MTNQAFSPTTTKTEEQPPERTMDFGDALQEVVAEKKITKLEWNNKEFYGILKDGKLMLHKPNGKLYHWIVSDGDILGADWIVI